jgi:IclR family acetate operon transcriptional repressor
MRRTSTAHRGRAGSKQLVFPGPAVHAWPQDGRTLGSLYKGLRILEVLSEHGDSLGLTELSGRIGMSKAGVYRLLFTLEHTGFVRQDSETGKYGLGMRLWEFGQHVVAGLTLQHASRPVIEALAASTGEAVHVGILDGDDVVYVDQAIGALPVQTPIFVGQRFPAAPLAIGKVVLALSPEAALERLLAKGLTKYTSRTVTDAAVYRTELRRVRARGYAMNRGEFRAEVASLAAPVFEHSGKVIAGLSLSGPVTRYTDAHIRRLIPRILEAAKETARRLGFEGRPG